MSKVFIHVCHIELVKLLWKCTISVIAHSNSVPFSLCIDIFSHQNNVTYFKDKGVQVLGEG
jgi:hypothetical protein